MNDFLSIYSMSILTYLYVETTAYKFRIYFIILTMKELAKLIYCCQDFGVTAFACVKALNNIVH
jgi:sensor histidine kinase YesM